MIGGMELAGPITFTPEQQQTIALVAALVLAAVLAPGAIIGAVVGSGRRNRVGERSWGLGCLGALLGMLATVAVLAAIATFPGWVADRGRTAPAPATTVAEPASTVRHLDVSVVRADPDRALVALRVDHVAPADAVGRCHEPLQVDATDDGDLIRVQVSALDPTPNGMPTDCVTASRVVFASVEHLAAGRPIEVAESDGSHRFVPDPAGPAGAYVEATGPGTTAG